MATTTGTEVRPTESPTETRWGALVAFFVLAYALSWAWAIPFAVSGQIVQRGDGWPTHYPALLGPMIAAFAVTAWITGRGGVRELVARMTKWRVKPRWWLVALSPVAFLVVALAVTGWDIPPADDFARFSGTPMIGLVGVFLLITFVGSLGEETGWRGYALPHLQTRFSPLTATLILAPLWFLWHLPQFFIIATYRDFATADYVGMFFGLTGGAVILTWLYNRSGGSILLVVIWHGVYNFVGATQAAVGTIAAVVSMLVLAQAVVLVVLDVYARRHGRPSVLRPSVPAGQGLTSRVQTIG